MTSRNPRCVIFLLSVFVISLISTSCYTYKTLEFDINIPEQAESSIVLASDGTLITTLVAPENRTSARRLEEIPEIARNAVLAIEDERFYKHDGFDLKGILRAARSNLEAGGISQGGSTITQQYVKLAIIENVEQTASRKLEELWYATRLEDEYGKDFILLQYLNTVYFGHGAYGIKAAAQTYFNKDISEISINEAALLAGLLKAPSRYDPFRNYSQSLRRSHLVLDRMVANQFITPEQRDEATESPPKLEEYKPRLETEYPAGHFVEEVRKWFLENPAFGANRSIREMLLYEGGVRIETTIDLDLQAAAEKSVEMHLPPNQNLPDASVVVIDPQTGQIIAMVGGRDFFAEEDDAKVNLAMGNGRQAGSSFKPIGLAAALESGWEVTATYPAPNVLEFFIPGADNDNRVWWVSGGLNGHDADEPKFEKGLMALFQFLVREGHIEIPEDHTETIEYRDDPEDDPEFVDIRLNEWMNNRKWEYSMNTLFDYRIKMLEDVPGWSWEPIEDTELIPMPEPPMVDLTRATRRSYNTVFAQLSMQMGAERVVNLARRLGVKSPVQPVNSNVLGTSNVTLLDMASAYSTFANRGVYTPPSMVTRVTRMDGTPLWKWNRELERALDSKLVDQLTWVLEGTISEGTGHRAKIDRPAAGKTGTTQNYADALFVGYTPQIATAVWVGYPKGQIPMVPPLTERKVYGGTFPALIWKDVMLAAHADLPVKDFATPPASSTTTIPSRGNLVMPELIGLTLENAELNLKDSGLEKQTLTVIEVTDADSEPGLVLGQSPATGTSLLDSSKILVEVAIQPVETSKTKVPDLIGEVLVEVSPLLASLGLGYEIALIPNPENENELPEIIWAQNPNPGTMVDSGSVISVRMAP
ncbi:MAG: Penicillin-binding protein 1A [Acidimicrobiaceae bacterium]|nr:MAG: Penicillin-binding protein 1A [Acidimicrobiaceae bacterium]